MHVNERLLITNIQDLTIDDGDGLRTTIFLKGCPLRCPWCCNPETQSQKIQYYKNKGKCIDHKGSVFCRECTGLDDESKDCLFGAREQVGFWISLDELKDKLDQSLVRNVTFSGGEPLMQQQVLIPLVRDLKRSNYNIAFETALGISPLKELIELVDEWIIDLKLQDPFYYHVPKEMIPGAKYRMVFFSELLEIPTWLYQLSKTLIDLNIKEIEILSYHNLGEIKYQELGIEYKRFTEPNIKHINNLVTFLKEFGISTTWLSL